MRLFGGMGYSIGWYDASVSFPRAMSQAAALARIFGECREGWIPRLLGAERTSQAMPRSLLQGIRDFLSLIRSYQGLKELDATVVNALIDKILVSEREKSADGTVRQEIKIYYKFIGFVGELHITPTKRWTAFPTKHCMVCGAEYVPGSGISKYCPACAKRIQREKPNDCKRRSREQKRMACIELSAKMTD